MGLGSSESPITSRAEGEGVDGPLGSRELGEDEEVGGDDEFVELVRGEAAAFFLGSEDGRPVSLVHVVAGDDVGVGFDERPAFTGFDFEGRHLRACGFCEEEEDLPRDFVDLPVRAEGIAERGVREFEGGVGGESVKFLCAHCVTILPAAVDRAASSP